MSAAGRLLLLPAVKEGRKGSREQGQDGCRWSESFAASGTVLQLLWLVLGLCPALTGWLSGAHLICELFAKPESRQEEAAEQELSRS